MTHEISLDTGAETIIHQGASTVELHEDGDITVKMTGGRLEVHSDGTVDAYMGGTVRLHSPANDAAQGESKPGDRMEDGTIYAGISPETHKPMYTTPADAPLTMKWKRAMDYAADLKAHGHEDWRVPTKAELNVLWENRDKGALKGTFNVTGSDPTGWYWSSTELNNLAGDQRFSDGSQGWTLKIGDSSLRCVRG